MRLSHMHTCYLVSRTRLFGQLIQHAAFKKHLKVNAKKCDFVLHRVKVEKRNWFACLTA